MKKCLSCVISLSLLISLLVLPASAWVGDVPQGETVYVETEEGLGHILFYQEGTDQFAVATEPDGTVTKLRLDGKTGDVYADGRLVTMKSTPKASAYGIYAAEDNWTEPHTYDTAFDIKGMGKLALQAFLTLKGFGWVSSTVIEAIVDAAVPKLYHRVILQQNYVDYWPKVATRQTDQFFLNEDYSGKPLVSNTTVSYR